MTIRLLMVMATLVTNLASVGATAAKTALAPTLGRVEAYLKHSKDLKYCIPNEHICAEIARFLGLPVPPSGIVYKQGNDPEYLFASLNFNLINSTLPPIDAAKCVANQAFLSTGIVLFDLLIANRDRHTNNLSLDISRTPAQLSIFDHSHALFGYENGKGRERLINFRGQFEIIGHCLLKAIPNDSHFSAWFDRIRNLPDYLIDDVCDATVPLGMINAAEAAEAKTFLKQRKLEIESIVKANRREFTAITQWNL